MASRTTLEEGARLRESCHKALWGELMSRVRFSSLAHFKRELRRLNRRRSRWKEVQSLGWKTPAEVCNGWRCFNKNPEGRSGSGRQRCQQKRSTIMVFYR